MLCVLLSHVTCVGLSRKQANRVATINMRDWDLIGFNKYLVGKVLFDLIDVRNIFI